MYTWLLAVIAVVVALSIVFFLKRWGLRRMTIKIRRIDASEGQKAPPLYADENVLFTVYRPKVVAPGKWYTLLAFAHLSEKRPGASADTPDPREEVKRQAKQSFGQQLDRQMSTQQQSAYAIPEKGLLTFVPRVEGIEFNPPSQSIHWLKDVHRVEFEMRASIESHPQGTRRGELTIFLGSLILAEVTLSILVSSEAAAPAPGEGDFVEDSAQPYRKIFPSYSHKDTEIVEQFEDYVESLGDTYLRDIKTLRSGEEWDKRLQQLIAEASIFQLFWSSNSMRSEFVRREWEYALSLNRSNFIRPIYWEDPLPRIPEQNLPPEALSSLHFYLLPGKARSRKGVTLPLGLPSYRRDRGPTTWSHSPKAAPPRHWTTTALKMAASIFIAVFTAYAAFFILRDDIDDETVTNTNTNWNANTSTANSNTNAPLTFGVSGQVRDEKGEPLEGVTIRLGGAESAKAVVTDTSGKFSFYELPVGRRYVLTPSKESYKFRPSARTVSEDRQKIEANFTAVAAARSTPGLLLR